MKYSIFVLINGAKSSFWFGLAISCELSFALAYLAECIQAELTQDCSVSVIKYKLVRDCDDKTILIHSIVKE